MMESLVLLNNEVALPDTFGCGVVSIEKDSHRVQESSWKVMSHYQQASEASRGPSFPPVICIKLQHLFCECVKSGMLHCRLIDEGDVLKDVLEYYNILFTDAKLAVIVRLPETELVFTDFKMSTTGGDLEFQSPDQAVGAVLCKELLASTPENIKTTVTISIPISSPCSILTQSEPQSVYDKVFEIDHIMDRIIMYVVGYNVTFNEFKKHHIKTVTAVDKCWRKSFCRVLELYGATSRTINIKVLDSTIKSFSGGFPLHNVIPYHLMIWVGDIEKLSGRALRFLERYPATTVTLTYLETQMEALHHILQFPRLKTLSVNVKLKRDILQDIQRMLNNSPILRRFEIMTQYTGNWIPRQDEGLILPESVKSLAMCIRSWEMTVISDQNQFKKVKHLLLQFHPCFLEVDPGFRNVDNDFEVGYDADNVQLEEEVDGNDQPDVGDELNVGQNQRNDEQMAGGVHDEDRNTPTSMLELSAARLCFMLKTMGPSLVVLDLCLDLVQKNMLYQKVSLPDMPELNSLGVDSDQIEFPTNLPSLERIHLTYGSMKFLSTLFIEGRKFERVTDLKIDSVIQAAFVATIASALPNCNKLTVAIRDDIEIVNDGTSAATLGNIFSKLPRLLLLEITCCTLDTQFLDLVLTGLSMQEIARLKQTAESLDDVFLGPRCITNLNCLQTLVIKMGNDLEIEVSDFLFRIAFMKMGTLTTLVLDRGITAGGEIMQQWKTMGRRVGRSSGDYASLEDLI